MNLRQLKITRISLSSLFINFPNKSVKFEIMVRKPKYFRFSQEFFIFSTHFQTHFLNIEHATINYTSETDKVQIYFSLNILKDLSQTMFSATNFETRNSL